jgi:hypothetical protein
VFARNGTTGALRQLPGRAGCLGPARGCTTPRRAAPWELSFSPDGRSVYGAGSTRASLTVFRRAR